LRGELLAINIVWIEVAAALFPEFSVLFGGEVADCIEELSIVSRPVDVAAGSVPLTSIDRG
jgi:hypothetical protein